MFLFAHDGFGENHATCLIPLNPGSRYPVERNVQVELPTVVMLEGDRLTTLSDFNCALLVQRETHEQTKTFKRFSSSIVL